jgi:hypothetical protein
MFGSCHSRASACAVLAPVLLFALGACGSLSSWTQLGLPSQSCADDSADCIAERGAQLRTMLSDKNRSWVREPAKPETYASGVRMFAFRGRKRELSCDELAIGRKEAEAAPVALRGEEAKGLSPAQISRGMMLAAEVSRELQAEIKRRCRA